METLAPPAECPGCQTPWSPEGRCTRCGLLLAEAMGWLREGCAAYDRARRAASEGRFADAQEHLDEVRQSGITKLIDDPAVVRLRELCASALGDSGVAVRMADGDEIAARNAVRRCDFRAAAFYAERAARALPGNVALQKLRLLTLYGAGKMKDAATVYAELKTVVPADPDLIRWRFAELEPTDTSSPRKPMAEAVVLMVAAGCALGGFWIGMWNRNREI